jgi:elongation factor 1-beta
MCDKPVKPIDPAKLPVVAAPVAKVIEAPKPAPVVAAKADDCDDLFGEETEEDKAAAAEAKKKAEVAKASKAKPTIIAKSIIVWEIKPYSSLTNIDYVAKKILAIKMDGLVWKTEYKKEPVAYGVFKLIIGAVVEDLKVSTDMVEETVLALEDDQPATKEKIAAEEGADVEEEEEDEDEGNFLVQSVDIQSFNKI